MVLSRKCTIRAADILLIAIVLLSAALLFVRQASRPVGTTATVERHGEILQIIDLTDPTRRVYPIDGPYPLSVVTENGAVWVTDASCPDHWCERSGKLVRSGETAACIPAGIVLYVNGSDSITDGTTG